MPRRFFYFDRAHAIRTHDWIIDNSGGKSGVNNIDLLDSPLEHIKNDLYYPNIEDKLTHLIFSVNKNHVFTDGNKRSSLALGVYFLRLNGYGYCVENFISKMENMVVWLADNVIDKDLLHEIITSLIYDDDYLESLKLKIARAIIQN